MININQNRIVQQSYLKFNMYHRQSRTLNEYNMVLLIKQNLITSNIQISPLNPSKSPKFYNPQQQVVFQNPRTVQVQKNTIFRQILPTTPKTEKKRPNNSFIEIRNTTKNLNQSPIKYENSQPQLVRIRKEGDSQTHQKNIFSQHLKAPEVTPVFRQSSVHELSRKLQEKTQQNEMLIQELQACREEFKKLEVKSVRKVSESDQVPSTTQSNHEKKRVSVYRCESGTYKCVYQECKLKSIITKKVQFNLRIEELQKELLEKDQIIEQKNMAIQSLSTQLNQRNSPTYIKQIKINIKNDRNNSQEKSKDDKMQLENKLKDINLYSNQQQSNGIDQNTDTLQDNSNFHTKELDIPPFSPIASLQQLKDGHFFSKDSGKDNQDNSTMLQTKLRKTQYESENFHNLN